MSKRGGDSTTAPTQYQLRKLRKCQRQVQQLNEAYDRYVRAWQEHGASLDHEAQLVSDVTEILGRDPTGGTR